MQTHRCKGSLANEMSIRKEIKFRVIWLPQDKQKKWRLFKHEEDWDTDAHHLRYICDIEYCPFCGKKL